MGIRLQVYTIPHAKFISPLDLDIGIQPFGRCQNDFGRE